MADSLQQKTKRQQVSPTKRDKKSFRDTQLTASGILEKDQRTEIVIDSSTKKIINRYESGTFNERFETVDGDDMLMHYVGLDRKPKEIVGDRGKRSNLVRVRYQNPQLHLNLDGDPTKYKSPKGSSSAIWLPEKIIQFYERATKIPTLFIQEGEKKADRATLAGLPSVGIMGIHNIAGRNKPLPHEFEQIIKRCQVENVCFILDSDYDQLGTSQHAPIDSRPKTFLRAVGNFRQYFYSFHHSNIPLNIYFGYITPNADHVKGIDDMLQSTLVPSDKEFVTDVNNALSKKESKYVTIHDITNQTEFHLAEIWNLKTPHDFAMHHKEALSNRSVFTIGKTKWRYNEAKSDIELAQPLMPHEIWWTEKVTKYGTDYEFNNIRCLRFLYNRGYGLLKRPNNDFIFIHEADGVVEEMNPKRIREYCIEFIKEHEIKNEPLVNKMLKGAKVYFGSDSLSDLDYRFPMFHRNDRGIQHFYFRDTFWRITEKEVQELPFTNVEGRVWKDQIVDFNANLFSKPLVSITEITPEFAKAQTDHETRDLYLRNIGAFIPHIPNDLKQYEFLDFLWNTSNFHWRNEKLTADQLFDVQQNFLAKITALGHLLHRYRDEHNEFAIVAMEGNFIEGGRSEGGTGKSLLAKGIEKVVPLEFINGKKDKLLDDQFIFGNVTESTAVVLIDDIRSDFEFEKLFPQITGQFYIRPLGKQGYTLAPEHAPKLYITTNFAPKENGRSFTRRRKLIAFSDFFNDENEPSDYYGHLFFADWDLNQWNIFHNLMANCIQLYFQARTVIQPDMSRINKRMLLENIGQTFIDWADAYFIPPSAKSPMGLNFNRQIIKDDAYKNDENSFVKMFPSAARFVSVSKFKEKLWKYCLLKDYIINPKKQYTGKRIPEYRGFDYGGDWKQNGVEFIYVSQLNSTVEIDIDAELKF
jgi:DNA primase